MHRKVKAALVSAAALLAMPAFAQDKPADAARDFGARAKVLQISLSPSGTKVAYVAAGPEHSELVYVFDLAGDLKDRLVATNREKITDLDWCEWATDSRLVCQVSGMANASTGGLLPFEWLFAVNDDGSGFTELSQRQSANAVQNLQFRGDVIAFDVGGDQGQILMSRQYVPEINAATRTYKDERGFGVDLLDAMTARRRVLEGADETALRYVADEQGQVRIKVRIMAGSPANMSISTARRAAPRGRSSKSSRWTASRSMALPRSLSIASAMSPTASSPRAAMTR